MTTTPRPIPLLSTISLEGVQQIEHRLNGGFTATPIAGLEGALQQRTSRPSHQIYLVGILAGEGAREKLAELQEAAANGEEITFSSDISNALELQKAVVTGFRAAEAAGHPDRYAYEIWLAESPPLPPPAQLSGFGGLDDFGLGDLGFDTDILGDLQNLADDAMDLAESALEAVDQLSALAGLADLGLGGLLEPLAKSTGEVDRIAGQMQDAGNLFAGDSQS